jgi:fructokinase
MKALGFGAVLWDKIIKIGISDQKKSRSEMTIGGSVFNVLGHLAKLGCDSYMVSALGGDELGTKAMEEFLRLNIHTDFLQKNDYPTCSVSVSFDENESPQYQLPPDVSWDHIDITEKHIEELCSHNFDVLIYGTIEQRNIVSRKSLNTILDSTPSLKKFIDLTLRDNFYDKNILHHSLKNADIIKMNLEEAVLINNLFHIDKKDPKDILQYISKEFESEIVCITCGAEGAYIGNTDSIFYKQAYNVTVSDTIGSGDAFSAGLLYKLHMGGALDDACDFGTKLGALVASKSGAIPDYKLSELAQM